MNQRLLKSVGRKGYWGTVEKPIKIAFDKMKAVKNDIMSAKNINVLIRKSQISYFRIKESGKNSWTIYDHGLSKFIK